MKKQILIAAAIVAAALTSCKKMYDVDRNTPGLIDIKCDSCNVSVTYKGTTHDIKAIGWAKMSFNYQQGQSLTIKNTGGTEAQVKIIDDGAAVMFKALNETEALTLELK